jgi:hypothetical protein
VRKFSETFVAGLDPDQTYRETFPTFDIQSMLRVVADASAAVQKR